MKDKLNPAATLHDIRYACEKIAIYTNDQEFEDWYEDTKTQDAVRSCFADIGEAVTRIRDHFPDISSRIPDKQTIIDFRNHILHHQYDGINLEQVWDTIKNDAPELQNTISNHSQ